MGKNIWRIKKYGQCPGFIDAALEKASIKVKIIDDDLYNMGYEKVADLASKIKPLLLGITSTTATIKDSLKYIKVAKELLPNTLTVICGFHVTVLTLETLKSEKSLDVVVVGEGEETIVDLFEKYEKKWYEPAFRSSRDILQA